jgi:hypothetical protein
MLVLTLVGQGWYQVISTLSYKENQESRMGYSHTFEMNLSLGYLS